MSDISQPKQINTNPEIIQTQNIIPIEELSDVIIYLFPKKQTNNDDDDDDDDSVDE